MWPEGGANVVTNPDFEEGGTGWAPLFGGTFSVTSSAYCGIAAGELSGRSAFFNALATTVPSTPATYNAAVWAKHDGTANLQLAIGGVCNTADAGQVFTPTTIVSADPNVWTFITGPLTVPSGCATMQFFVGQPTSAVAPFPDLFADEVYVGQ
jgi:hypothetical protein